MRERPGNVVFRIGELLLKHLLPTRVITFEFALMAALGTLVAGGRLPAGTSLRLRALCLGLTLCAFEPTGCTWRRAMRRLQIGHLGFNLPRLGTVEERGNAGLAT